MAVAGHGEEARQRLLAKAGPRRGGFARAGPAQEQEKEERAVAGESWAGGGNAARPAGKRNGLRAETEEEKEKLFPFF